MKFRRVGLVTFALLAVGCSHPLDIIGEGDILSASGDRDCLLSDAQAGTDNCAENLVVDAYDETYYAVAHPGWYFHRWLNYCIDAPGSECSFNVSADAVQESWGATMPPLVAIFRKTVNTGFTSLFIGHSFFRPFADGMPFHAAQAGFVDHTQSKIIAGGANGAPQALWENASKRAEIQAILDDGDVALFVMTYHGAYPTMEGYERWIDYALAKNPDTRFALALPWEPNPGNTDATTYASGWQTVHSTTWHEFIDTLRALYPGVDIYCIPYGQSAGELRLLFADGNLDDVDSLVSASGDAIYSDSFGHADDILIDLGRLVWLNAIYGVELSTYAHNPGYNADLKAIAQAIMDGHDPAYNAPYR